MHVESFKPNKSVSNLPTDSKILSNIVPNQIIDIKMVDPAVNSQAETHNKFKFLISFSTSVKSDTPKVKYWVKDLSIFGSLSFDLLSKFRKNILEVTVTKGMKNFSVSRLKMLDEYLTAVGGGFIIKNQSGENDAIGAPLNYMQRSPSLQQQSSTIDPSQKLPPKKDFFIEKEEKNFVNELINDFESKTPKPLKSFTTPIKQLVFELPTPPKQDSSKTKKLSNVKRTCFLNKKVKFDDDIDNGLLSPDMNNITNSKKKVNNHVAIEGDDSAHKVKRQKQVEDKLDFIINIQLNEILLDMKKKYFGATYIQTANAAEELEEMHKRITRILDEVDTKDLLFE
jgi:hypothetical protein